VLTVAFFYKILEGIFLYIYSNSLLVLPGGGGSPSDLIQGPNKEKSSQSAEKKLKKIKKMNVQSIYTHDVVCIIYILCCWAVSFCPAALRPGTY
jgi:hypothetical protein